jgi:hypothetical protein
VLIEYWVVQITAGRRVAQATACPPGGDRTRQSPGCGDLALESGRMTEVGRRVASQAAEVTSHVAPCEPRSRVAGHEFVSIWSRVLLTCDYAC